MDAGARLGVLGPVRASAGGARTALGSGKAVALLGLLASDRRRVWPDDVVVRALWDDAEHGDRAHVLAALRVHASDLRRRLDPVGVCVEWVGSGYRLAGGSARVDVEIARRHAERGDAAMRFGDLQHASREYALALREWRGQPFEGVVAPYVAGLREALEYWHREIRQNRLEADLGLGLGALHLDESRDLCEADRYDERACRHRVVALSQAGRRAEALEVYGAFRRRLVRVLGVEPGAELVEAHARVLRGGHGGVALRRVAW
ncbi:AfsR/SARP family transcriptional regulator [Demequina lignilytica]|uniref:AfsR/SARP family transcriptional regulator n=1 Tax=Demequina lignilytica TaxID=3051663 RepID=A0AB35MIA2_9MICO|nr:AfsR/SARP family transcriptional regulator [Demequina sp. SYSU T0a273]MDN4483493.1 AfsR/SARP family transcriptional regulator [Demequina sp. SYSU T0a273]